MYNIIQHPYTYYSEVSQPNPLRWSILLKKKGNVYKEKTSLFRCREFFNDLVAKAGGTTYTVFNFPLSSIPSLKKGCFVLCSFIQNKPLFLTNLQTLNTKLKEDLGVEIGFIDDEQETDRQILHFPAKLFESTYYISMATMFIRCSNYSKELPTWEAWKTSDVWNTERTWHPLSRKDQLLDWGFAPLEALPRNSFLIGGFPSTDKYCLHADGAMCWAWKAEIINKGAVCVV